MPEKWTGNLVGLMHNHKIKLEQLANKLGCTKAYVSMVLNGKRSPTNAEQTFQKAVEDLISERDV